MPRARVTQPNERRSAASSRACHSRCCLQLVALLVALVALLSVLTHGWLAWEWTHPADAQQPLTQLSAATTAAVTARAGASAATQQGSEAVSAEGSGDDVERAANDWVIGRVAPSAAGRYLFFMPAAGYANQVHGFVKAMAVANAFHRTLVVPPLLSSHLVGQHSWFDKRGESNATASTPPTLRIRVRLQKLLQYEQLSRYARVNASVLATGEYVLASELVQWRGPEMDCWRWPNKTQVYGVGEYTDTNATVLCIGITHGMPPIDATQQPHLRFDARLHDWLLLDDEVVRDSRLWLLAAAIDPAAYVCVHHRGGDFQQWMGSSYLTVKELVQYVNATIGIQHNTMLITDTEDVAERAQLGRLPWCELSPEHVYTLEPIDKLRDVKKLHMDMHLCAQAATFVGCERSSMSRLIRAMRDCAPHSPGCLDSCVGRYPPQ